MREPEGSAAAEERLIARALAALDATPLSVAAAAGLDRHALAGMLAGRGEREAAARLANAFRRASTELEVVAEELSAAVQEPLSTELRDPRRAEP